jgi:hypothetical protein
MSARARYAQRFRRECRRRLEEALGDMPEEHATELIEALRSHGHPREAELFRQVRAKEIRRRETLVHEDESGSATRFGH